MYPERLINDARRCKSSNSDHSFFNDQRTNSFLTKNKTERLTEQIDLILEEQKEFLKELNLTVCDDDGFRVEESQITEAHFGDKGDTVTFDFKNNQKTYNSLKDKFFGKPTEDEQIVVSKPVFFASGDRKTSPKVEEDSQGILCRSINKKSRPTKPKVFFMEEPVKLPKTTYDSSSSDILQVNSLKDHDGTKHVSVKMLFYPTSELSASNSSMGSDEGGNSLQATSSVYMTASNSNEEVKQQDSDKAIYSVSDSSCSLCVKASTSDSKDQLSS